MSTRVERPGIRLPYPLRALGALAAGASVGSGFAPTSWWPLLLLGLAGFTLLVVGRSARGVAGLGYLFGLGLCAVAISWLNGLGWWIAVLLVVWMALYFVGYALALRLVLRLPAWPLWAAAAWTLVEFVTCRWPFGGFGWIRLGYTVIDTPVAGLLRYIGVPGVSYVVALLGQLIAAVGVVVVARPRRGLAGSAVVERPRRGLGAAALTAALGLVAASALGGVALTVLPKPTQGDGTITVGVVQGNVDGVNKLEPFGRARSVTNNHLSETVALYAKVNSGQLPRPDFVLWPENSTDIDPTQDSETAAVINAASDIAGVPILVGAVTAGPGADERQTGGLWWTTDGTVTQTYFKRNLVPFGEYIPYRSILLPRIPILALTGEQGIPGTRTGIFTTTNAAGQSVKIGDVICFELAYDATVYDTARAGAQILVVQSNNASYGGTPQVPQQWAMTRARAIETGRDIAVATTDSLSGIIRADGTVVYKSQEFTADATSAALQLRSDRTPALLLAPIIDKATAVVAVAAILVGWALRIRARRASRRARHTGGESNSTGGSR